MKVIGIIAEYNPFHNGHAYQIARLKQKTNADFVIVAMSGDFVQRGAPAIVDKYCRTKMALSCGVDLVIELPTVWSVSSAEDFAMAGVTLFDKMNCIDGICFGAESDNLPLLKIIADILAEEPDAYKSALASYLKKGMTFPSARAAALTDYFKNNLQSFYSCTEEISSIVNYSIESLISILSTPNNILAIEYLKALKRRNSVMTPILIPRAGSGYHDTAIHAPSGKLYFSEDEQHSQPTASASAIRTAISDFMTADKSPVSLCEIAISMPEPAFTLFQNEILSGSFLNTDDFSSILGYRILSCNKEDLLDISDMTPEIANRILKNKYHFSSFTQFSEKNKSRDITYTRMSRILMHLLLRITDADVKRYKEADYIPYLRILGFRKDSADLLSVLKKNVTVPVISKLSKSLHTFDGTAKYMLEQDIFAAELYEQQKAGKTKDCFSCPECSKQIIRI